MAANNKIQLTAQCFCKNQKFVASVARDTLPFETGYCHCTSCRHVTGGLFSCIVPWAGSRSDIWNSSLKRYTFSKRVTLFFCCECSSPMFFHFSTGSGENGGQGRFEVNVAVLPNIGNLIRIRDHLYVADTVDGGAAAMMRHPNTDGAPVQLWKGMRYQSEMLDEDWPTKEYLKKLQETPEPDEVPIHCHCRGAQFILRIRPMEFASTEREKLPSFVDPKTNKLIATFDACNSCRLTCGALPVYWTSSFIQHVDFGEDSGKEKDSSSSSKGFPQTISGLSEAVDLSISGGRGGRFGTLSSFRSSAHVVRYFCSTCSASIFYTADDAPNVIEIPIGVLDFRNGARADNVLEWKHGSVGYVEDVTGGWREGFMESVRRDSEAWQVRARDL